MTSVAAAIIDELKEAFVATRAVRFSPMVNSVNREEPLQVEADFADKDDWTKLQSEWLDLVPGGFASALNFLSDEAIRFYIPAYLVADLMGGLDRVDPVFSLVHGFDDASRDREWLNFARARWHGLTQKQAVAIVHYLEWRVERDGVDIERNIVEALAAYWYPRAAGIQPAFSRT